MEAIFPEGIMGDQLNEKGCDSSKNKAEEKKVFNRRSANMPLVVKDETFSAPGNIDYSPNPNQSPRGRQGPSRRSVNMPQSPASSEDEVSLFNSNLILC